MSRRKRRGKDKWDDSLTAAINRQKDQYAKTILAQSGLGAMRAHQGQYEPPVPPPVFSECVIGYRVWMIDALGRLRPQAVNQRPWVPGENTAVCDKRHGFGGFITYGGSFGMDPCQPAPKDHKAPAKNCECGFYARFAPHDLPEIAYDLDQGTWLVAGSTAGWGDMQVHADGMRSEKACVTALAVSDNMPPEIRALVEQVAETYRVPAVPLNSLSAEALLHGCPLPDDHRPKPIPKRDYFSQLYTTVSGNFIVSPGSFIQYGSSSNGGV